MSPFLSPGHPQMCLINLLKFFMLLVLLSGCLPYTRNVTGAGQYDSDYKQGAVYLLEREAALTKRPRRMWLEEAILDVPRYGAERPAYAAKSEDRIIATLPVGTQIRFERLVYWYYFESDEVLPIGRIIGGPYAGLDVNLVDISESGESKRGFTYRTRIDADWLRPAEPP